MENVFQKMWYRFWSGMGLAMIFTFLFVSISYARGVDALQTKSLLINMIAASVIGVVYLVANLIFEIEEWNLTKQTILHFLIMFSIYFPIAIWVGWLPLQFIPLFISSIAFIFIYVIIWLCIKAYWKRKINSLNNKIIR
ncbi:DUF3021 domain-containing protein [Microbacteriaceae bacterium 4G12]